MSKDRFVIGVDFGTDSVRSVIVNADNGNEIASSVFYYSRWKKGSFCNASLNQFRQHPLDYIEGLEATIKDCLQKAGNEIAKNIKAISVDTTGSTPVAVDKNGTPLALLPEFDKNPNAMFVLWKDHTATKEAAEINHHATKFVQRTPNGDTDYLKFVGGIYSSEWFWAKLLHIVREDEQIRKACYSFVEHCDWIPFLLTGRNDVHQMKRGVCSAGHKALWSNEWKGLPPNDFFASLDPLLQNFTSRLFTKVYTSDQSAGTLSKEWAERLGLSTEVVIGVGAFDAHMGAVGGQIEPYYLSKVMGTSTCDMLVAPEKDVDDKLVKGICGQVDGSIIPGMIGMEAGQSAFGDVYAWFGNLISSDNKQERIAGLSEEAAKLSLNESDELALDWLNGRRTPDADQTLKAAIIHLNLASDAPKIFKALVEATCYGAKAIVDRFNEEGIPVKGLIGLGGVAKKSPYIMQVMADVMNIPIKIHKTEHTCAMGAAMFAATAASIYDKVEDAMQAMGKGFDKEYFPDQNKVGFYKKRYEQYKRLGIFIEKNASTPLSIKGRSKYQHIKEQAYEANMQLPKQGLVIFTFGNVSAADRDLGVFAIKPSGVPYDELSPDKMVIVDFDGKIVEGNLRPSSDTKTHAVLYKHWKNIGGICHTHSTYATAWAQAAIDIPLFGTTHADHNTVPIPCALPMDDKMIEGDYEYQTGFQILDCFKERKLNYEDVEMILVGNHAPFTWGKNAEKAVYNSAILEQIAKMAYLAIQINDDAKDLKASLIKKHYERKHGKEAYYGQSDSY